VAGEGRNKTYDADKDLLKEERKSSFDKSFDLMCLSTTFCACSRMVLRRRSYLSQCQHKQHNNSIKIELQNARKMVT
jgi:hypothetical protein